MSGHKKLGEQEGGRVGVSVVCTRVNLDIVDGSIQKVLAPGAIVRLRIKYIYLRTIHVTHFLLSESAYDETEIVLLPK